MEEEEKKISESEFEEICRSRCDLSGLEAKGINSDFFWCSIYRDVCEHVGHLFISETSGMPLDLHICQEQLKGLVECHRSDPFNEDVLVIAGKYIAEVIAKGNDYAD